MQILAAVIDVLTNGLPLPAVHGGGDGGAGLVGLLDVLLESINRIVETGGRDFNPIAGLMALGTNVHPVIVHYPIAFLTGFLLLELIGVWKRHTGIRQIASGMLYLGAIGAVAAAAAGLIAEGSVPHGHDVHEIMEWHERFGLAVAILSVALAVWRWVAGTQLSRMAQTLHLAGACLIVAFVFFGADLGGLMVYEHGVGVHNLQQANASLAHETEHSGSGHHGHGEASAEAAGEQQ